MKLSKVTDSPKSIIERYLKGESTESIAKDFGVTRQGLGYYLLKNAEAEWKDAQLILATERLEKAEQALEEATESYQVQRAAHMIKSAQWMLERVQRNIYGQQVEANQNPVVINIGIKRGETIDQVNVEDVSDGA